MSLTLRSEFRTYRTDDVFQYSHQLCLFEMARPRVCEMTTHLKVRTFDEMMWPTLQALKETGGSASNQELLTRVAQLMAIPEEIQNLPPGDGPRTEVDYRMLWARTYLRAFLRMNAMSVKYSRTIWSEPSSISQNPNRAARSFFEHSR
jgi:hypothetical protein